MQTETEKPKDKVENKPEAKPHENLPSVDHIALMQETPKKGPDTGSAFLPKTTIEGLESESSTKKPAAAQIRPGEGKTHGGSGLSDEKPSVEKPSDEKPSNKPEPAAEAARPESKISIEKSTTVDPKAPTIAFLDAFKDKDVALDFGTYASHGEISRAAAEKNGFNTIAVNVEKNKDGSVKEPLPTLLGNVADKIESGQLKLGRGDVLNVSLGLKQPPTFAEASKFLGFPVSRENLATEKNHILSRLNEIKSDPARTQEDRDKAKNAVDTNKAIERIQASGVEVVKSAGNLGPDHFDWAGLSAKHQLSATTPTGKLTDFSAENTLTEKGIGVYPVRYNNEADLLSPTPVAKQIGNVEIAGVKYPIERQYAHPNLAYNPDRTELKDQLVLANQNKQNVDSSVLLPQLTLKDQSQVFKPTAVDNQTATTHQVAMTEIPSNIAYVPTFPIGRDLMKDEQGIQGLVSGTSFSNIDYLKRQYGRLKQIKSLQ